MDKMAAKQVQQYFNKDKRILKQRMARQQEKAKQQKAKPKVKEIQKSKQAQEKSKIEGLKPHVKQEIQKEGKVLKPHVKLTNEVKKSPSKAPKTPTKDETSSYQPSREQHKAQAPKQEQKGMSL